MIHPDLHDAALKMKIAYEDWQDNLGSSEYYDRLKREFEDARNCYRSVKRGLEERGIVHGMEKP